jgi:hypothetical protein
MDDGALELPPAPIAPVKVTPDAFLRMAEAGAFAEIEGRVELDRGLIVMAPHEGEQHLSVGERVNRAWMPILAANPALSARVSLFIPGTIVLADSVRSPDLMLCRPGLIGHGALPRGPDVFLAMEYADTTLAYDEKTKRVDYAAGGVGECWIVRIGARDLRVCRGPMTDGTWREDFIVKPGDRPLAPLAAPELMLDVGALFA